MRRHLTAFAFILSSPALVQCLCQTLRLIFFSDPGRSHGARQTFDPSHSFGPSWFHRFFSSPGPDYLGLSRWRPWQQLFDFPPRPSDVLPSEYHPYVSVFHSPPFVRSPCSGCEIWRSLFWPLGVKKTGLTLPRPM